MPKLICSFYSPVAQQVEQVAVNNGRNDDSNR